MVFPETSEDAVGGPAEGDEPEGYQAMFEVAEPEFGRALSRMQRVVVAGREPVFVRPVDFAEPALEPVAADSAVDTAGKQDDDPGIRNTGLSGPV